MRSLATIACCVLLTVLAAGSSSAQDSAPAASTALLIEVKDAIGPATKEHFLSGLARAEEERMQHPRIASIRSKSAARSRAASAAPSRAWRQAAPPSLLRVGVPLPAPR